MTSLPRAATATELTKLRTDNQSTRLYLTVHNPATVYTARLAAVPSSTDQVTSITYNTGSGTHTNILADQTMLIGTSAGASDLGMVRIRNTTGIGATSGTFNIGEESEIAWSSGAYLTVLDEFLICPRHIKMQGTTPYIDEITYTDQNSKCDSIPVLGPDRVLWLKDATVSTTLDASNSWALNNTITGYVWTAPGASATSGLSTATPTITYNAVGTYRVGCTVTNDDTVSFTGYRYIFVVDDTHGVTSQFTLDGIEGSQSSGGWSARVTLYDDATTSSIRDRALCVIHSRDWYGNDEGSIGFVSGAENVLFVGWLNGQTIMRGRDDLYSTVSFEISGPQYWIDQITAFPVGLKDRTTTPTKWTRFLGLTPKATVWHLLHWRSTITRCCDVYPLDNAYRAARIEAPGAQTLWQQLTTIEDTTVKAAPCADRFGRLFNQIEQQLLDDTARASIAEVMTLTTSDLYDNIDMERNTVDQSSITDLSGVSFDGTTPTARAALSPGHVFARIGKVDSVDRLVCYDTAQTIALAGLWRGWKNNNYPRVSINLASNHRLIDIVPYQYFNLSVAATDTPRGVAFSGRIIPRSIRGAYQDGYMLWQADCEAETFEQLAIENVIPEITITPVDPPPPPVFVPPVIPLPASDAKEVWIATTDSLYWSGDYFLGGQPSWNKIFVGANAQQWFGITAGGMIYIFNNNALYMNSSANVIGGNPATTVLSIRGVPSVSINAVYPKSTLIRGSRAYTIWQHDLTTTRWTHGTHNGTSWTQHECNDYNTSGPETFSPNFYAFNGQARDIGDNIIDSSGYDFGGRVGWSNSTYRFYLNQPSGVSNHIYLRQNTSLTGANIIDLGNTINPTTAMDNTHITGAQNGERIYVVSGADDTAGALYYSADGASFANIATWQSGWVYDAKYAGGGSLVWVPQSLTAGNVATRLYAQDGTLMRDMTGNFWSLASGDQTIVGVGLVYS